MCVKKSYKEKIYKRTIGFQFCVHINQNIKMFVRVQVNQNIKISFAYRLIKILKLCSHAD